MADLELVANKKFRIMEDYNQRKQKLENHAVKLILREHLDPNAPMIPAVESAAIRQNCGWCNQPYWAVRGQYLCDKCDAAQKVEVELQRALNEVEREIRMATAQEQLERLRYSQANGDPIPPGVIEFARSLQSDPY